MKNYVTVTQISWLSDFGLSLHPSSYLGYYKGQDHGILHLRGDVPVSGDITIPRDYS